MGLRWKDWNQGQRAKPIVCGKFPWRQPCGLVKIGKALFPRRTLPWNPTPKLSRDEYIQQMRQKMEETLGQVADAINEAPPGQIISGSEEQVRDLFADLRQTGLRDRPCRCESMRRKPLFPPPKDPSTGKTKRNKGRQDFTVLTINGRVQLWRRRWYSPEEGTTTPLDRVAGHRRGHDQPRACARWPAGSTATARTSTRRRPTWRARPRSQLSGETLRVLVEAEGKRVLQAQRSGQLAVDWSAADCQTEAGDDAGLLRQRRGDGADGDRRREDVAAAEGQGEAAASAGKKARPLPPRKAGADQHYKEFKIVAFYDEDAGASAGLRHAGRPRGGRAADASRSRPHPVRPGRREGGQRGRLAVDPQPGRSGSACRWTHLGLDFYHLSENVHKARREIYGEDDEAGKQWAGELLHVFKHERLRGGLGAACWSGVSACAAASGQAADRLLNYVSERREMIRYPEFLAKGWQIGSGPTEATCKTLTARLKGSGMRWDADNAEALMALEALTQSGQWDAYWQTQLRPTG